MTWTPNLKGATVQPGELQYVARARPTVPDSVTNFTASVWAWVDCPEFDDPESGKTMELLVRASGLLVLRCRTTSDVIVTVMVTARVSS
jgi:hypothetical protein